MAKTKRKIIRIVKVRKLSYFGHIVRKDSLQKDLLEGKIEWEKGQGKSQN